MEHLHGPLGFFNPGHLDEAIALGAVGVPVVNNLDLTNRAHAFEEIFEVMFGRVVGEIPDIESLPFDLRTIRGWTWFLAGPRGLPSPALAVGSIADILLAGLWTLFGRCFGLIEPKKLQDFLPGRERLWLGSPPTGAVALILALPLLISLSSSAILRIAVAIVILVSIAIPVSVAIPVAISISTSLGRGTTG